MNVLNIYIGPKIRQIREKAGVTVAALAKAIVYDLSCLKNVENGRMPIALPKIYEIAHALNVEITEFLPSLQWYSTNRGKEISIENTYKIK